MIRCNALTLVPSRWMLHFEGPHSPNKLALQTLRGEGREHGTALGVNAAFVEVAAVPKNASDEWLREWRVLDGPPRWRSTTTGTNPAPGFTLPAASGGNTSLRYTVAASHVSGHCSLLASATMRELHMVSPSFFTPGAVGRHCGGPNLLRLPGSTERWLLKYEGTTGGRGSMFSLGSVQGSAQGPRFEATTPPAPESVPWTRWWPPSAGQPPASPSTGTSCSPTCVST